MTSIVTGDIINSRDVSNTLWLPLLKEVFNRIGSSPKTWEIYRGDSFQLEISDASTTLLEVMKIKAAVKTIKDLDVRMAIGIGSKDFDSNRITESSGQAFINSGYGFDNFLKKQTLAIKSTWEALDQEMNISLSLGLLVMDHWTQNSAELVNHTLKMEPNQTQKELAHLLGISQSSASERRKRAGIDELLKLEKRYRKLVLSYINQS
ncbi:MAG: transcriptional regulator [Flavobacteriaceae bacterium]|nr:MAG: transcriptional regulator [Flavobacteriaceae bacterium]